MFTMRPVGPRHSMGELEVSSAPDRAVEKSAKIVMRTRQLGRMRCIHSSQGFRKVTEHLSAPNEISPQFQKDTRPLKLVLGVHCHPQHPDNSRGKRHEILR